MSISKTVTEVVQHIKYVDIVRQSACIEMPARIFKSALDLAVNRDISLENHENHQAIRVLCEWWNANAPNPECRCAGAFEIFCWEGQDELVAALQETPNINLTLFTDNHMQQCIARVSDRILLLFLKPLSKCEDFGDHHYWNRVDGDRWIDLSCPKKDADNAWWTWKSMQEFRRNFPEIVQNVEFIPCKD